MELGEHNKVSNGTSLDNSKKGPKNYNGAVTRQNLGNSH